MSLKKFIPDELIKKNNNFFNEIEYYQSIYQVLSGS